VSRTPDYTLHLADRRATLGQVGGKGASLARLAQAGLPVPGGFHVTTGAYRRFVADNNLQPAILAALRAVRPAQPSMLETASLTIAHLFARAVMPSEIADASARASTASRPSWDGRRHPAHPQRRRHHRRREHGRGDVAW
jgi:rifampicin phosphotransferase